MTSDRPDVPQAGDVVVVPFPFADRNATKRRPALVLSSAEFAERTGTLLLAMITTSTHSSWPGDVAVRDFQAAGLRVPCMVRWKLATRDRTLVVGRPGRLSHRDRAIAARAMKQVLAL